MTFENTHHCIHCTCQCQACEDEKQIKCLDKQKVKELLNYVEKYTNKSYYFKKFYLKEYERMKKELFGEEK